MEDTDVDVQGTDTQPEDTAQDGGFFVPDEYKSAGWAQNIKSYNDLWKMNSNAQSLIGKKTIGIPSENSTPEELQSFYEKIRPEKAEDYGFEIEGDDKAFYEKLFFDNGISKGQAKGIMTAYQNKMKELQSSLTSEDGFKTEMQGRFGDKYEDTVKSLTALIGREANDDDKAVLNSLPNNALGVVYGILNSIKERYAIKDSDTAKAGGGATNTSPNYAEYCKDVEALNRRPHTMADLEALKMKHNIPIKK